MILYDYITLYGLPWWLSSKESAYNAEDSLQCRLGFNPCVRMIPWRRKWQPNLFLPENSHGQWSLAGCSPCDRKRVRINLETKPDG